MKQRGRHAGHSRGVSREMAARPRLASLSVTGVCVGTGGDAALIESHLWDKGVGGWNRVGFDTYVTHKQSFLRSFFLCRSRHTYAVSAFSCRLSSIMFKHRHKMHTTLLYVYISSIYPRANASKQSIMHPLHAQLL